MSTFVLASMALGIGVGLLLGLAATKRLIASEFGRTSKAAPIIGGALATSPAMFLSVVVGGQAGGGFGELLLGRVGTAVGLAIGIAAVLSAGISLGAIAGSAVGWFVIRTCRAVK